MNTFLIYILESTVCISVFYLLFRLLMRNETSFAVSRTTLLTIVVASVIVPLVQLPQLMHTPVHVELIPDFSESKIQIQNLPLTENATTFEVQPSISESTSAINKLTIPLETLLFYFYLTGVLVAFLFFIRNVILILLLSRKATVRQMDGYRLLIVDREVPSFAFGRSVVISQTDYEAHGSAILAHEQAHIRLNHFVDLLLLEVVRAIHWFNPAVYALIGDMKEIHEFQADKQTLHSGIDATQYQLLIIQKGVGPRRFALANSFNHCQIKKRIIMMNKSKTSKAWRWKVATFLPLLALLLMAFGNRSENVPEKIIAPPEIVQENQNDPSSRLIEIRKDGNYIDKKLCTLEEIFNKGKEWGKASNDWIHIRIDESITFNRIDEILEQLEAAKIYHITQSTVNSDDIIYSMVDVSEMAKFTQGKWDDWMKSQLNQLSEGKSNSVDYKITYSFVIDKNGKVKDGHLIKGCDHPEINTVIEKMLTQIPDWKPATKGNQPVSILYKETWTKNTKGNAIRLLIPPPPPPPPAVRAVEIAPPNPNKDRRFVWLKNNGTLRYDLEYITFDVLAEKVKSDLQNNPKLQFDIMVEEGKIDERVDKIKNILKVNGNPKVRYSSFHEEKETDSKGAIQYRISSKTMDIK